MTARILVAVDDTAESIVAARLAAQVAARTGAHLRAVHVLTDTGPQPSDGGRRRAGLAVLSRVARIAGEQGVGADTELLVGAPGAEILRAARHWHADLVVVGRAARRTRGDPYVGVQTQHVLEFSEVPVLVVPIPD